MPATRTANHVAVAYGSDVVHAAADLISMRRHVLACNGRAIEASAWNAAPETVTCRACRAGLASGRITWEGR